MNMKSGKLFALLMIVMLAVAGCKNDDGTGSSTSGVDSKGTVKLAYVNWAEGVAVANLAEVILSDMGYEVEMTMADVAPIYAAISKGDQDVMIETWMPVTHLSYWEKYGENFDEIGIWFLDARIGLVVPDYVDVESISDLNDAKADFDGTIVGIDAGAGIMKSTEKAIETYGLDYNLMTSSGPAMTAALKSAIDKQEAIVVTGWAPHWMFARYKLKFLNDPENIYGSVEVIKTIARKGFKEDMPEVSALFGAMNFDSEQVGSLMDKVSQADGDTTLVIREWMATNKELVDSWMPAEIAD